MNKPIKPEITIPQSFAENGVKTDFDDTLLADGFDNLRPDVLAGDNLNKFIDDTYKGLNYGMAAADALNLINEGETLIVRNGEFTSGAAGGGGLEIGDIGIAPLGIDETKGKRRYLNGQVIIQDQYVQFTNKVKSAVALYPSLTCTESEWQTTATMTVGGQVGKFVVDDEAGTIRLPKIIMPIQGLTDLSKLAEIVEAGLPDHKHTCVGYDSRKQYSQNTNAEWGARFTPNTQTTSLASTSNPTYGNSDTVQQEQIQYPYFIQVATGAETEDNIINEIELNNPYSFGDSKYSPVALNNLSWLKSEGQYNSKAVYPAYYDWLLKIYNGTEVVEGVSVKLSTEEYTDYDFVINTAEETFRLPLLDGSEDLLSNKYTDLTLGASGDSYTAPANGWFYLSKRGIQAYDYIRIDNNTSGFSQTYHLATTNIAGKMIIACTKGDNISVFYSVTGETEAFKFIYAKGNGSLYFYVGETVQNANLINAGRIEEKLVDKVDTNASNFTAEGRSLISSYAMPSNKYIDLTLGASGTTYTAPANGWFKLEKVTGITNAYLSILNSHRGDRNTTTGNNTSYSMTCEMLVRAGEAVTITYNASGATNYFRFIYAKGEV